MEKFFNWLAKQIINTEAFKECIEGFRKEIADLIITAIKAIK